MDVETAVEAAEEKTEVERLLAKKPLLANLTLTTANKEYKITLPPEGRKLMLQARTSVALRLSFERGAVADTTLGRDYWTLKAGDVYYEDFLDLDGTLIIYVACGTAGVIVEIIKWWK